MSIKIIQQRLEDYHCQTVLEEENALKEITQEITLLALSRAGFFSEVEFHGGTALRILYGLQRFSEDLDFACLLPNHAFDLQHYLKTLTDEFSSFGYAISIQDRSKAGQTVRKAFLKDDSIGKILLLQYPQLTRITKKILIKLEVDTNPPAGSTTELKYLDFPLPFSIQTKDLPSSFAGKTHALLCRSYLKGRDWYDFIWYVARGTPINYQLLTNAIDQIGPWQGQKTVINKNWLLNQFEKKIISINWEQAAQDVMRFLKPIDQQTTKLWSRSFFISRLEKLEQKL